MRTGLIHWNLEEGGERAAFLGRRGITVDFGPFGRETIEKTGDDPPDGFEATLGPLPDGVLIRRRATGKSQVVIFFCRPRCGERASIRDLSTTRSAR